MKFAVVPVLLALCALFFVSDAVPSGPSGSRSGSSGGNAPPNIYGCSDSQFAVYWAKFKELDTDNDCKLSKQDLNSLMIKMGQTLSEEELDGMMQLVDKNGDGMIDFDEYMAWVGKVEYDEDALKEAFDILKDENGVISPDHFRTILQRMGAHSEEGLQKMFDTLDVDKDGVLTFEEFKPILKKMTGRR